MKKSATITLPALALLLASAWSGHAAPYFPYDTIENYYKTQPEPPSPPPSQLPAERPLSATPRAGQLPVAITQVPEFLFPEKLGFGVAVGVPYDLMYISEAYYCWQGGMWYRSSSYRGPWTALGSSQLPPELRDNKLVKIRQLRNLEYAAYWKDRAGYKGRQFRPGTESQENLPSK